MVHWYLTTAQNKNSNIMDGQHYQQNNNDFIRLLKIILWLTTALCLLVIFTGCKSQRKVAEHTHTRAQNTRIYKDMSIHTLDADYGSWWVDSIMSHTVVYLRVYDTNKDIDSISGKPPIVMEAEITKDLTNTRTGADSARAELTESHIKADTITAQNEIINEYSEDKNVSMAYNYQICLLVFSLIFIYAGLVVYFKD